MSYIAVDTELLNAQSSRVRATMERISSDVASMRAGLNELQSTWRGTASSNFQSVVAEWSVTQARVESNLAAINNALNVAAMSYRETETANTTRFTH